MGVLLLLSTPACLMTRAQGEKLELKMSDLEGEVAKLQRVRHDLEVLLSGKVALLYDRISRLESSLISLRESIYEGASENGKLVAELQYLRSQLEEAKHRYESLEKNQESLANAHAAAKNKTTAPASKEDHFALAKKHYLSGKFEEAINLFDEFIKKYESDNDLSSQSYFLLGEMYSQMADNQSDVKEQAILKKHAIVNWQKIVELSSTSNLREESLYKIGVTLESLDNKEGALAAFKELLSQNKNSSRANEAKKHIAKLEE